MTHGGGLCSRGVDRGPVRAPSEWLISRCALSERGRSLGASITCLRRACACSPVPSFQRRKSYASRCACTNLCRGEDLRRVAHHGAGARWQAFNEWRCAPRQRPARHTIPAAAQTHALLRIRCSWLLSAEEADSRDTGQAGSRSLALPAPTRLATHGCVRMAVCACRWDDRERRVRVYAACRASVGRICASG